MKYTSEQIVSQEAIGHFGESFIDHVHKVLNQNLADAILQNDDKDIIVHFSDFYENELVDIPYSVSMRRYITIEPLVRCRDCVHAKQHSYAPAECQWYCTASLQYHGDRFFCACGERRKDERK